MSKSYFERAVLFLLGVPMIIFGLNKVLGFIQLTPPEGAMARQFLTTMFTSYLVYVVALAETLGGVLILIPATAFVGYLILGTVIVNIAWFHFAHDLPGNGLWIFFSVLYLIATYFFRRPLSALFQRA